MSSAYSWTNGKFLRDDDTGTTVAVVQQQVVPETSEAQCLSRKGTFLPDRLQCALPQCEIPEYYNGGGCCPGYEDVSGACLHEHISRENLLTVVDSAFSRYRSQIDSDSTLIAELRNKIENLAVLKDEERDRAISDLTGDLNAKIEARNSTIANQQSTLADNTRVLIGVTIAGGVSLLLLVVIFVAYLRRRS